VGKFKVVQTEDYGFHAPEWVFSQLKDAGIDFTVALSETKEELTRNAGDADLVWNFGCGTLLWGDNLLALQKCGAILRSGSGTDNIDVARATELGIIVVNTPHVVAPSVADQAISLLFSLARQVTRHDRLIRRGQWDFQAATPSRSFQGATLGLIGFGRIPQLIARRLSGFEMKVIAFDPYVDSERMATLGVRGAPWDEVFQTADFVSVHCPLTDETRGSIGEREFRMMEPDALFVNTSRGQVVDEPALIRALQEGWIAGAALDVLEKEPPDDDNPLLTMENVILTPHIGGTSHRFPEEFYEGSVEAILDLAAGRWPRSIVNPNVKPRWSSLSPSIHSD